MIKIDKSWHLFLDRDGVINKKRPDDYVKTIAELEILPGVLDAIKQLTQQFNKIFIITNQRGISRKIMTEKDLQTVHTHLLKQIETADGKIDKIYYCPHLRDDKCNCRKPNPGMGLQAKKDYPEIDFSKSIMVGDSLSDMGFGKNLGMTTIHISQDKINNSNIDYSFENLHDTANFLLSLHK
jgi:histidinol-phosphate phosphatase family protein